MLGLEQLDFKGNNLLVIGAGHSQLGGIKKAIELGCHVMAIDGNPKSEGLRYAHESAVIDFSNVEKVISFTENRKIDGVVAFCCDVALPAVAAVSEKLGLPGLTKDQVNRTLNKYELRKHCEDHGIPNPVFTVVFNVDDAVNACFKTGYPCVLKPVDSSGSRGVTLISTEKEVEAAFYRASKFTNSGVIIEGFIDGIESNIDGFVLKDRVQIITISDKLRTNPPYLIDTDIMFPTTYNGKLLNKIKRSAIDIIKSLDLAPTPFHMEMIINNSEPRLVEIALRGPGAKIFSDIIPRVSGVDVLAATIALAFNENIKLNPTNQSASVIKFFSGRNGIIHEIQGVEDAKKIPGVEEIYLYFETGDKTPEFTSGLDRIGHIIAFADNRDQAVSNANNASGKIRITYS